jgi:putative iron-regulated protein
MVTPARSNRPALAAIACACLIGCAARAAAQESRPSELRAEIVRGYAAWAHRAYADCAKASRELERAASRLVAMPSAESLEAAKAAWVAGRRAYGPTEVLRFYEGPVDARDGGSETQLNAWPLDESYVDYVEGAPDAGIVNDPARFPNVVETALVFANERGGEANVTLGWHAIEFLLWGQDRDPVGPGARPFTDYVAGTGRNAERRARYLLVACALLARQLGDLERAWAPGADNYRRRFEADPATALRRMLTGAVVLSGFEMAGERLAVAYETRDEEQEHSCFSDTTHMDFERNQAGVEAVLRGVHDGRTFGPGVVAALRAEHPAIAADVDRKLVAAREALAAMPRPFDRAIRGADDAPGRRAVRAAMLALEAQAEALSIAGRALGYELPLKPGS